MLLNIEIVKQSKGNIFKIIDKKKNNLKSFNEIYVTSINSNIIKAWKKHSKTNLYLTVISGSVLFVTIKNKVFNSFLLNSKLKSVLKIEKNVIFGFKGISKTNSKILVISEIVHNSSESTNYDLSKFHFKW